MIELRGGVSAGELTKRLLVGHNLFVKDLSVKMKNDSRQFLRVAIRNSEDNLRLAEALRKETGR